MTNAPQLYIGLVAFGLVTSQGCSGEGGQDDGVFNDGAMQRVELNKPGASPAAKDLPAPAGKPVAKPVVKPAPVKDGYVLTHEHPTYGMAFGGNYAFSGAPGNFRNGVMEKGYTAECGGCKMLSGCDHGEVKGNITAATGSLGSDMGDHASLKGPVHDSNSHLRYSTEWVKEAFKPTEAEFQDSRMRIMVAFAVENEAMCEQLYYANKGKGGTGGDGYPCSKGDSLASLERQLDALKAWAAANSSWMEIAYTAADARRIVNADKLAIVLGIESEYSFGAEDRTFDPVERLNRYYDKGVRTFYLAHKINSRLAGADIYHSNDSVGGKTIRATQAISGCFYYDDNVGPFPLKNEQGHNFCNNDCGNNFFKGNKLGGLTDKCAGKFSEISEVNMADYVLTRGGGTFNGFAIYPLPPGFKGSGGLRTDNNKVQRNNLGLSHDGERVVREAMLKGMIVNIDHVSSTARKEMHNLATQHFGGYPLNALHNNPNELLTGAGTDAKAFRHEYDFDDTELNYISETGGFFGVRLGPFDAANYGESGVTANCAKTSTESAKFLAYLLKRNLKVGYSLDYATVTQGVHSRTMTNCGRELGTDYLHKYGTEIADGLSHIGMMKKWHKELEVVGLKGEYVDQLKNDGAAAFVAMWEKAEAKSTVGKQIPRQTFANNLGGGPNCAEDSGCASDQYCGDPVLGKRTCKALKAQGAACTSASQCATGRCSAFICAAADECQADSGCPSGQYCGDPIAGKRSCKALKAHGVGCTSASQCATNRCSWGFCADADECQTDPDCASNQYCGDPISGKRTCKALKAHGVGCTSASQCASDRCSWGFCADADECRSNGDCKVGEYCGDPISGKAKCKDLLADGKACTKGIQCKSGKCSFFKCKD